MFSTLRRRLIFSHILPLLVIVPLIGLALIYLLEARVVLPSLTNELTSQAGLVVEMARDEPGVWSDPALAQAFVATREPPTHRAPDGARRQRAVVGVQRSERSRAFGGAPRPSRTGPSVVRSAFHSSKRAAKGCAPKWPTCWRPHWGRINASPAWCG